MNHLYLLVGLLGYTALSQGQGILEMIGNLKASDASTKVLNYARSHPIQEESAKLDDTLEDLKATRRAIQMTKPKKSPDKVDEFKIEIDKIKNFAKILRPAARNFRRNLQTPRGIGEELDVILNVVKTSIMNVIDAIEKLMPNTGPIANFMRRFVVFLFG